MERIRREPLLGALTGTGILVGTNLLLASVVVHGAAFLMVPALVVLLPSLIVGFR